MWLQVAPGTHTFSGTRSLPTSLAPPPHRVERITKVRGVSSMGCVTELTVHDVSVSNRNGARSSPLPTARCSFRRISACVFVRRSSLRMKLFVVRGGGVHAALPEYSDLCRQWGAYVERRCCLPVSKVLHRMSECGCASNHAFSPNSKPRRILQYERTYTHAQGRYGVVSLVRW